MKYWERYICSALLLFCLPNIIKETIKYYDKEVDDTLFEYFLVNLAITYEDIYTVE